MISYPEFKLVLEETSDEITIGMHFDPVPAGVGDHDSGDTLCNGVIVSRHMDAEKSLAVNNSVILVDALLGPAITNKVLGTGHNIVPVERRISY